MELTGQKVVAYTCISNTAFTNDDYEKIAKTKAYKQLTSGLKKNAVYELYPDIEIRADVISGPHRKRPILNDIIYQFKHSVYAFTRIYGVIVIQNLTALGSTREIAQENYLYLIHEHVGIYILDKRLKKFSTVKLSGYFDYDASYFDYISDEILYESKVPFESNRGIEKKTKEFSEEFKKIYWYYEHYYIPEPLAYNNNLTGKTSRVTFHRYCDAYERSEEYINDEIAWNLTNVPHDILLEEKAKRHGKITQDILDCIRNVSLGQISEEQAADMLNMSLITFRRYCKKGTGRKSMSEATYRFKQDDLIKNLQL